MFLFVSVIPTCAAKGLFSVSSYFAWHFDFLNFLNLGLLLVVIKSLSFLSIILPPFSASGSPNVHDTCTCTFFWIPRPQTPFQLLQLRNSPASPLPIWSTPRWLASARRNGRLHIKSVHPLISDDSDSLKYTWRDEQNFPFYKFDGNFVCALIMWAEQEHFHAQIRPNNIRTFCPEDIDLPNSNTNLLSLNSIIHVVNVGVHAYQAGMILAWYAGRKMPLRGN